MKRVVKTLRFPETVLNEIKPIINKQNTNFTGFVISAIENYVNTLKFTESVNKSFGAWNSNPHPELNNGVEQYIRDIRKGRTF
ncbi:MAG: hypothetical protein HY934_05910 [Candidatus Firestonebacteria bacterium]|nr:hypothetical protein [Candidatus Firestonebacteria bacterium]